MSNTPSIPPGSKRPSLVNELDSALGELDVTDLPTVFLVSLSGRLAGKLFKIRPGESIIGRSSRAFICLDEKAVSHKHAKLTLRPEGCAIEDTQSTNGTYLNDVKLSGEHILHAGDVIRIGNNSLGFLTDADDEQQHTRAMARLTAPRMALTAPNAASGMTSASNVSGMIVQSQPPPPPGAEFTQLGRPISHEEEEVSPLDNALDKLELAWAFCGRHWKAIVLGTLLGCAAGTSFALMRPVTSIAEFEIYLRQDYTPDPSRPQHAPDLAIQGGEFFAFAERKFTEGPLVHETLKSLNRPSTRGDVASTADRLAFSPVDRRGTFKGTYSDVNAGFAERFLAAHLQNFLQAEINKALSVQASEVDLMRREFEKNEVVLARVEKDLRTFKEKHLRALPENAVGQIQSRGVLLTQRDQLAANISRYSGDLNLAKQQLASEDVLIGSKLARSEPYQAALAKVKQEIAAALAKGYAAGHPELIRLRGEEQRLDALKNEAIQAQTTDLDRKSNIGHQSLNARIGELTVMLKSAQQELDQVDGRLGEIESLTRKMPGVEAELTQLLRAQAAAKEIHDRLNFELKGKELQLQFERASVAARYEIMRAPHAQTPPRAATVIKFGGAGTAGGLILGIAWGLVRQLIEYARRRKVKVTPPSAIVRIT